LLVLGFNNGQIMVLDINFNAITKRCDKREGKAISQIKFSPNDAVCAVGAMDSNIFTYDVKQKFKPMKRLRGHHSRITHLDFS
jgi:WD40 repeat protein